MAEGTAWARISRYRAASPGRGSNGRLPHPSPPFLGGRSAGPLGGAGNDLEDLVDRTLLPYLVHDHGEPGHAPRPVASVFACRRGAIAVRREMEERDLAALRIDDPVLRYSGVDGFTPDVFLISQADDVVASEGDAEITTLRQASSPPPVASVGGGGGFRRG